jgi:hypothetical protein
MRRLNAREEFCLWCGREGFSVDQAETLLACSAKLSKLGSQEANGFRSVSEEERWTVSRVRALKELGKVLAETKYEARTGDGWITTGLHVKGSERTAAEGRRVPR